MLPLAILGGNMTDDLSVFFFSVLFYKFHLLGTFYMAFF